MFQGIGFKVVDQAFKGTWIHANINNSTFVIIATITTIFEAIKKQKTKFSPKENSTF